MTFDFSFVLPARPFVFRLAAVLRAVRCCANLSRRAAKYHSMVKYFAPLKNGYQINYGLRGLEFGRAGMNHNPRNLEFIWYPFWRPVDLKA